MDKGKGERKRPDFPSDDKRRVAAELCAHGISRASFAYRDHLRDATKTYHLTIIGKMVKPS